MSEQASGSSSEPPATNPPQDNSEAEKAAGQYAWSYFQYHAGQRLSVFRFYLAVITAATIAYGYSQRPIPHIQPQITIVTQSGTQQPPLRKATRPSQQHREIAEPFDISLIVGSVYLITSFLFWRLDERNRILIGFSEEALKASERRLAAKLNDPSIQLMLHGEKLNERCAFRLFERFKQIHRWIFFLVGAGGVALILHHFRVL